MFENEFYIAQLVAARIKGSITDAQQSELDAWLGASEQNAVQYQKYIDEGEQDEKLRKYYNVDSAAVFKKINDRLRSNRGGLPVVVSDRVSEVAGGNQNVHKQTSLKLWIRIGVAAAAVLLVFSGIWFYTKGTGDFNNEEIHYASDVLPGKQGATLTLANGKKISLTDAANGELAEEAGVKITKTADGQLIYEINDSKPSVSESVSAVNTLSTSSGETYQIQLPDGTKAWLNAASSIRFPSSFSGLKHRRVEITGEVYLEVFKDKTSPFIVSSNDQQIEVLGTHFNVNNYADDSSVKTTLLEGLVRVSPLNSASSLSYSEEVILKPGQQSIFKGKDIQVRTVDVDEVVAWKEGYFRFVDKSVTEIMKHIAR